MGKMRQMAERPASPALLTSGFASKQRTYKMLGAA